MKNKEHSMSDEIMDGFKNEGIELDQETRSLYQRILSTTAQWEVPGEGRSEEVWDHINNRIDSREAKSILFTPWMKWAASITVVMLISLALLLSNPQTENYVASEIQEIELPDGSTVSLNAGSTLSYSESLFGDRNVQLKGRAFFDVTKGDPFLIKTVNGTVSVLGTSFNVNSFENSLYVECFTGKVEVGTADGSALLTRGKAVRSEAGIIGEVQDFDLTNASSWMEGEFYFQNRSLVEVFREVENQYGITVNLNLTNSERSFTGLFNNTDDVEEVLKSICLPMGLDLNQTQEGIYEVND